MFCHNCGKELTKDSRFCPFCGARVLTNDTKGALNIDFTAKPREDTPAKSNNALLSIGYFILSVVPFLFALVMMAVQDAIADPRISNHLFDLFILYFCPVLCIAAHIKLSHHLIQKQDAGEYKIPLPILMKINDKLFSFYLVLAIAFFTFCSVGVYHRTGSFSGVVGYWIAGCTLLGARYYYRKLAKKH